MQRKGWLIALILLAMLPVGISSALFKALAAEMAASNGLSGDELSYLNIAFSAAQLVALLAAPFTVRHFTVTRTLRASLLMASLCQMVFAFTHQSPWLHGATWVVLGFCVSIITLTINLLILDQYGYRAMTLFTALVLTCSTLLPLGGYPWFLTWLVTQVEWQWLAYPLAGSLLLAAAISTKFSIRHPFARTKKSHFLAYACSALALTLLVYLLMRGSYYNWFDYPGFEYAMLGVIVIALLAMLFMQASQNSGHTSSRTLLTNLHNNVFMYNGFLAGFGVTASGALMMLFLTNVLHYSHQTAGQIQLPSLLAMIVGMMISVAASNQRRFPSDIITPIGVVLLVISVVMFSRLPAYVGPDQVLLPICLRGLGVGLLNVSVTIAMLAHFRPEQRPEGISVFYVCRTLGGLLGSALFTRLLQVTRTESMTDLTRDIGAEPAAFYAHSTQQMLLSQGHLPSAPISASLMQQTISQQVIVSALGNTFLWFVVAVAVMAPVILIGKKMVKKQAKAA
ncbi:MFS transporter [Vibrio fluvialis]|uniref:MFS transporter n=1 Tax=Vibrio fluvialis TaxID=676 RepID=UPI0028DFE676|nr:MFS transporter [Vibrio fluvialis]MDT8869357.1 MFS transporter [Vibrio fluvialis]MDT8877010.1 MFS transporter [Vibrio fluvialis]